MNWWKSLRGKIRFEESLRKHTTLKIGGPAKFFIEPKDADDLKLLIILAKRYNIPILVMGAGSNILVNDNGVQAIVLQLNSPSFKNITFNKNCLEVGSGLKLKQLIQTAQEHGLSGVEFLAGIPGTVGGALVMNAGAWGKNIGDLVKKVSVMDYYNGNIKILTKKNIKFAYRKSNLNKFIILSANFELSRKNKREIKQNLKQYLTRRRDTQDASFPNAGCVFRNPLGQSAGRLIDLCGLKGKKQGDAYISQRHANFILNTGGARASDVLKLMDLVKEEVKKKFHITLKPEIKIWH